MSLGHEVVDKLAAPYYTHNHHLYFAWFFSSMDLMTHLYQQGTYACGTIMPNRKELSVKTTKLKERGEPIQRQKGPVMTTVYKDKRQIFSTNQKPGMTAVHNTVIPTVIAAYNMNMGSVDKSDQYRAYNPVSYANKKWLRYIFNSLVNLWYKHFSPRRDRNTTPPQKRGYDRLLF